MNRVVIAILMMTVSAGRYRAQRDAPGSAVGAQRIGPPTLTDILQKTGEAVQRYTDGVVSISCTETARQEELEGDLRTVKKKPTELVYDFIVLQQQPAGAIKESRQLKLLDGKPATKDAKPPAPDPTAYTTALSFLLPQNRAKYVFSYAGTGHVDGHEALLLDFAPAMPEHPEVTWQGNLFRLHFQSKGRVFIDPARYDVLRIDMHLTEPFEFDSSRATRRKGPFVTIGPSQKFRVELWDVTIRFGPASFPDPEQILLLPQSAESVRVIQGSRVPRLRTTHSFTNYRRFIGDIKIQ